MALTYSPDAQLGMPCPIFQLKGVDGKNYSLADFRDKNVFVVMFICNHCPYVKAIEARLIDLALELKDQSVQFVAICSNDPADYPEDSFDGLKKRAEEKNYPFPYLHDDTQAAAKSFGAECTPDFFVFDKNRQLAYRGRLDDSWKNPALVKNQEMKNAILSLLAERPPATQQMPSMGCSIKWL